MRTIRATTLIAAAILFRAAIPCSGQEIHITTMEPSSGRLDFTLAPAGAGSDYSCVVEWRSTLHTGNWTNVWYQPLIPFASSNGMFHAALPHFFRISCVPGQSTNVPPVTYTVTGVIASQIVGGLIYWPDTGNTNLIYFVEQATGTNGPWLGQWNCQTNLHAATTVTNMVTVPVFFRVVTIEASGELPW